MTFEEYISTIQPKQTPGIIPECGSCAYHDWNIIDHRNYCRCVSSTEQGLPKDNHDGCDCWKQRERRGLSWPEQ